MDIDSKIEVYGKKLSILRWAAISNVNPTRIVNRLNQGVETKSAVFTMEIDDPIPNSITVNGPPTGTARRDPIASHEIEYHGGRFHGGEW